MSKKSSITSTSGSSFTVNSDGYSVTLSTENNKLILKDNLNQDMPLKATSGGTGLTTYTTGDILYASSTNTLNKKTIGTDGYILTASSGVPTWSPLGGDLSGTATSQNVIKIQNRSVADTSVLPRTGQQLTWSQDNLRWQYQWNTSTNSLLQDKAGRCGISSSLLNI